MYFIYKNLIMKKNLIIITSLCLFSSCATVFSGKKQTVRFQSNTEGAKVMLNTTQIGNTNQPISINKSEMGGLIRVSKDGCQTKEMELPLTIAPAYYGNIVTILLFGVGTIGVIWDLGNHSYIKTDKVINVDLDCGKK